MGSCLAELLCRRGSEVTLVTPANAVSAWTFMSNELVDIRVRMIELGIGTVFEHLLTGFGDGAVQLASIYRRSDVSSIDCGSLLIVGFRAGNDHLFRELNSGADRIANAGISSVRSIGDCRAPGTIAHAVYSGHECARTIDAGDSIQPFELERPRLSIKA
jgi:dimethylamine/trimethylamine dehydrogenase